MLHPIARGCWVGCAGGGVTGGDCNGASKPLGLQALQRAQDRQSLHPASSPPGAGHGSMVPAVEKPGLLRPTAQLAPLHPTGSAVREQSPCPDHQPCLPEHLRLPPAWVAHTGPLLLRDTATLPQPSGIITEHLLSTPVFCPRAWLQRCNAAWWRGP